MHNDSNTRPNGTRVTHKGTGEHGTVTATATDDLGLLVTVQWDDPAALELPRTLQAKHLEAAPYAFPLPACTAHTFQWEDGERDTCYRCGAKGPEAGHAPDGEKTAELRRRGLPTTATELVSEAKRQGMKPAALLRHCQAVGAL